MRESFEKNKKGILLMIFSSICVCVGQLLWKISIERGFEVLLLGLICYAVGAVVMIIAYRFGKLSVLQPMLSLNYVLSLILAAVILNEVITFVKCIGVIIIIIGVVFIAGGDKE